MSMVNAGRKISVWYVPISRKPRRSGRASWEGVAEGPPDGPVAAVGPVGVSASWEPWLHPAAATTATRRIRAGHARRMPQRYVGGVRMSSHRGLDRGLRPGSEERREARGTLGHDPSEGESAHAEARDLHGPRSHPGGPRGAAGPGRAAGVPPWSRLRDALAGGHRGPPAAVPDLERRADLHVLWHGRAGVGRGQPVLPG